MTNRHNARFTLKQAAVDWITITAANGSAAQRLYKEGCTLLDIQKRLGNKVIKQQPHGYEGTHCGAVFIGRNGDAVMLRVTGCIAHEAATILQDVDVTITRIDVQTTWQIEGVDATWAECEQRNALRKRSSLGLYHLSHIRHILGNGKGDTTMVGSRTSPRYGRLYDKARESGEARYDNCWRYEVEYKQEVARNVWVELCKDNFSTRTIVGIVSEQYQSWMFDVDFMEGVSVPIEGAGRAKVDAQKKLEWIQSQVVPSMEFIVEAGYKPQLLLVLNGVDGLDIEIK